MTQLNNVINYPFGEQFIPAIADYIEENYIKKGADLSRLAFVFGGRRPALFLQRELAGRLNKTIYPPRFFTVDEFVRFIVAKRRPAGLFSEVDSRYHIYRLSQELAPDILRGRNTFSRFLPWAGEIVSFIGQLDLEAVKDEALRGVKGNAAIGYDVPEAINRLLVHIGAMRTRFHDEQARLCKYTREFLYLLAAQAAGDEKLDEFEQVFFCNFFYLHATEKEIIASLLRRGKATAVFQGDEKEWPVLADTAKALGCRISPSGEKRAAGSVQLYAGYDTHSQVSIVREIISDPAARRRGVLLVPDAEAVLPLVAGAAPLLGEYNISMGYPLKRSSFHALLECIMAAQKSRKSDTYYTKDYLRAIGHPLIKNMRMGERPDVTRIVVHTIEQFMVGSQESQLAGSLFVKLADIESNKELQAAARETIAGAGVYVDEEKTKDFIKGLHRLLFRMWEPLETFAALADTVEEFAGVLSEYSFLNAYPLNTKAAGALIDLAGEFRNSEFSTEKFEQDELFSIIEQRLEETRISFAGSPLKGFQILGMLEARSLSFDTVIAMDMNESVVPNIGHQNALIPRDVMLELGLRRLEKEEEIQRYHFMRLIAGAKNVHLVYSTHPKNERSRFIEELVWSGQKESKTLSVMPVKTVRFDVSTVKAGRPVPKAGGVSEFLSAFRYSPTAIDTYLHCPLKFYFRFVLRLAEKENIDEEPGSAEIGAFIHQVLERAFKRFINNAPSMDSHFRASFLKEVDEMFEERFAARMKSDAFLLKEVIIHRLSEFIDNEMRRARVEIREIAAVERKFTEDIVLGEKKFRFNARVDRIDRLKDGTLLIIDYKTGSATAPAQLPLLREMAADLNRESIKKAVRSFQLPVYVEIAGKAFSGSTLDAALYDLRACEMKNYFKEKTPAEKTEKVRIIREALTFVLNEIADPAVPFIPDDTNPAMCGYCPFYNMCR